MDERSGRWIRWSARILACLVCLFLSVFALDAFGDGKSLSRALPDFAMHLAPVFVLLAVVAISWRWALVGGLVFTGLAGVYAYAARDHASWVIAISAPMLAVGVLYFWSWLNDRNQGTQAHA